MDTYFYPLSLILVGIIIQVCLYLFVDDCKNDEDLEKGEKDEKCEKGEKPRN